MERFYRFPFVLYLFLCSSDTTIHCVENSPEFFTMRFLDSKVKIDYPFRSLIAREDGFSKMKKKKKKQQKTKNKKTKQKTIALNEKDNFMPKLVANKILIRSISFARNFRKIITRKYWREDHSNTHTTWILYLFPPGGRK